MFDIVTGLQQFIILHQLLLTFESLYSRLWPQLTYHSTVNWYI